MVNTENVAISPKCILRKAQTTPTEDATKEAAVRTAPI